MIWKNTVGKKWVARSGVWIFFFFFFFFFLTFPRIVMIWKNTVGKKEKIIYIYREAPFKMVVSVPVIS